MSKRLDWIPYLGIAALLALCGCRSQDQAAADNNGNPVAMTASQAKAATGDVTIGHQLSADGSISGDQKGNNFTAGQPVIVALKIGRAPVGTPVTIDWYGPNNQQLATDQRAVAQGDQMMSFTSKGTSSWGAGDYHADLSVGGQKVDSERFSMVAADKAENGVNKPSNAVSDVTVGHQLGADGAIAAGQDGKNFVPGQPVFIAFTTGGAPAGTTVEIDWFGPNDQHLGTDKKQINAGDTVMHFASNKTSGWGLGDYRADLKVNGQKVDTEHFNIVNATKADKTGKGR